MLVKALYDRGIQTVIVGSDAHQPSDVGNGISEAVHLLLEIGYSEVSLFDKRKSKRISLDSFK
jgi:histidinol phosphatase-like PHP family hydrolase